MKYIEISFRFVRDLDQKDEPCVGELIKNCSQQLAKNLNANCIQHSIKYSEKEPPMNTVERIIRDWQAFGLPKHQEEIKDS